MESNASSGWEPTEKSSRSEVSRRGLLLVGAGLTGALMGGRMLWQSIARNQRSVDLDRAADRVLARPERAQLAVLPKRAATKVELFFDGVCLDVHRFTGEVCSLAFGERLRACTQEEDRRKLLHQAFTDKLIAASEITRQVDRICRETADQLDQEWAATCHELEGGWGDVLANRQLVVQLETRINPLIAAEVRAAAAATTPLADRPALGETGVGIGLAALQLLPAVPFVGKVVVPAFVVLALGYLFQFIWGRLAQQERLYREAVSEQLTLLAGKVAAECELAFSERVSQLQHWQETGIRKVSRQIAQQTIRLIG